MYEKRYVKKDMWKKMCRKEKIMNKPYVTLEEVKKNQGENARGYKLLTEANGCVAGCCSGISIYNSTEFNYNAGAHEDQEGFFVLEGEGFAKLDDLVFPITQGDSFIAAAGVKHTIKTSDEYKPVKVFWFHSSLNI